LIFFLLRVIVFSMVNNNTVISLNTSSYDRVAFDRKELSTILSIYGRMVSAGEWRDYGISMLRHIAIFSIFRRSAEHPVFTIQKIPKLANKQQLYSVVAMDGRILKRGSNLKTVLHVLEKKLIRAVN
jgi:hypothetical protein